MDWRSRHVLILLAKNIHVCMDGRSRVFDNIIAERLWRTVKYEKGYT